MKTKESLGIFWSCTTEEGVHQEEVDGLLFYGYWTDCLALSPTLDYENFEKCWVPSNVSIQHRRSEVERYAQFSVDLRIHTWPSPTQWIICIEKSLKWFTRQGAAISWCGTEYSSADVGTSFSNSSSGNIYAAYSDDTGLVYGSGLNDEYQELSLEILDSFGSIGK